MVKSGGVGGKGRLGAGDLDGHEAGGLQAGGELRDFEEELLEAVLLAEGVAADGGGNFFVDDFDLLLGPFLREWERCRRGRRRGRRRR